MNQILNILLNTPWWAFVLFVALMIFGVQALRPRTVPVWRLLITPAVFIGWGVISLVLQSSPLLILNWLLPAAVGYGLMRITSRQGEIRLDRTGSVTITGSVLPLARNLLIFAAKYALAAAAAIDPAQRQHLAFWDIAVSGASAGYFLGWLARIALEYQRVRSDFVAQGR